MKNILTADQFVAGIVSTLALRKMTHFEVQNTELDQKFKNAFEALMAESANYDVVPNFSFYTDPLHGDSVTLRETLNAAKEKELIAFNNPTLHTFDIKVGTDRAERYLAGFPLPKAFFNRIVDSCFAD